MSHLCIKPACGPSCSMCRHLPADDGERLTLGAINARLAPVSITVAGLTQLGFEPVAMDKAARLYRACDFPAICRAISEHALSAATKKATP